MHCTDGITFLFFNLWTVCSCCSPTSFLFYRRDIKKKTKSSFVSSDLHPRITNQAQLRAITLFSHQDILRVWDWHAEMAQCHSDTGAHPLTLLWEVRKLFTERKAQDKNSKVPCTPSFQWAIIITDMSALLWVGSAEAGGEADKR